MACRRGIWSRSCRRWSATGFCGAFADRAAAISSPASGAASPPTTSCARPAAPRRPNGLSLAESTLVHDVVVPALVQAETAFAGALARINVEDLADCAQGLEQRAGAA